MGIGTKIKKLLKAKKKTIKWLSQVSGVSINTLYSITKRDSVYVSMAILEKLAGALEVPVNSLFPDPVEVYDDEELTSDWIRAELKIIAKTISEHYRGLPPHAAKKWAARETQHTIKENNPWDFLYCKWGNLDTADSQLVVASQHITDQEIEEDILSTFRVLNRRGKLEAMVRLDELYRNPRFSTLFDEEDVPQENQKDEHSPKEGETPLPEKEG